jgi:hypothetical protein
MAGLPGVFIGHTDRFAWGFTNTGPDVTDLVLTKVEGDAYEYDGDLVPLDVRTERIEVAGGDPVDITIRATESGPIISDVIEAGENYATIGAEAPVPAPGFTDAGDPGSDYAVALRWTALEPGVTFDAFALPVGKQDSQGYGSAATYVRRYSLMAAAGIAPIDDDGRAAVVKLEHPVPERHAIGIGEGDEGRLADVGDAPVCGVDGLHGGASGWRDRAGMLRMMARRTQARQSVASGGSGGI